MEKPKEKPPEFFKSVKTSLKSILKHREINTAIINGSIKGTQIRMKIYLNIKLEIQTCMRT